MSKCPFAKECGACNWQDISYEEEIAIKKKEINELFKSINYNKEVTITPSENCNNYRNKAIIAFKISKTKKVVSGIYEESSHKIVAVTDCLIQAPEINQVIKDLNEVLNKNKILPFGYDGVLKHGVIRYGHITKDILVTLVTSSINFPGRQNVVKDLIKLNLHIKTIVQNVQDRDTPIVLGETEKVLYGPGYIYDFLGGLKFKISSKSFYQINSIQTEKLYQKAIEYADMKKEDIFLDAYSGIGTIGLIASCNCKKILSVENNKNAIFDARGNAKINNINNVEFVCDDSTRFMKELSRQNNKIDGVFLDPPRSGTTNEFISAVADLNVKKVVYVSCNPETLVRDLVLFEKRGYKINSVSSFDMFPRTKHVETVALLVKK